MTELYWITRFDSICGFLTLISVFSAIVTVITFIIWCSSYRYRGCKNPDSSYYDEYCLYKFSAKITKCTCAAFFIAILCNVFMPTTKDALAIYGIGGTIDYVKNNEKAKQLPDKVINALDRYVDTIANDSIREAQLQNK